MVGGTAYSSGPTCYWISHQVLSVAHARIGGWVLSYDEIRVGGDAPPEKIAPRTAWRARSVRGWEESPLEAGETSEEEGNTEERKDGF